MEKKFGGPGRRGAVWPGRRYVFSLFVAGAVALALLTVGVGLPRAAGTTVPDFSVDTAAGKHTFSQQRGKIMVYFFSFPGWVECVREVPALNRIQTEFKDKNLQVVAVNVFPHFSIKQWGDFWRFAGGGDVLLANDTNREAIRALNVYTAGATVIIDRNGRIVFQDASASEYGPLREGVGKALP